TKNGNAFASGSGPGFGFTPDDNGSFVATLTVTDKDGGTGTASVTMPVFNVAPTAHAGANQTALPGQTVTFTGTFTDPGSADTQRFTWHVAAGNGQVIPDGTAQNF